MGNIATTVEQQIALLESRGMIFDCEIEKVKETLLDIGVNSFFEVLLLSLCFKDT